MYSLESELNTSHLLSLYLTSVIVSNIKKQSGHAGLHDRLSVTFQFPPHCKEQKLFQSLFSKLGHSATILQGMLMWEVH